MPSWASIIRRALASPGERGPNARRIAEGLGEDIGTRGSWWRRIAEGRGNTDGPGSWQRRLAGAQDPAAHGSWERRLSIDGTLDGGGGPPAGRQLTLGGNPLTLSGSPLVLGD